MTEWRDDIKKIMMKAGLQSLPITFLFTDAQVQNGKDRERNIHIPKSEKFFKRILEFQINDSLTLSQFHL